MIEQVVFDLDGTLIDSAPSILASLAATLASHGIKPEKSLDPSIIGPPLRETLIRLTGSDEPTLLDSLTATFKSEYDTIGYKATTAFPGVRELLEELAQRNIAIIIATNKRLSPTGLILEYLGWSKLFRRVYALDCIEPPFSNKAKLLAQVLQDVGLTPRQVAYVGDKLEDGLAADENSIPFFSANWGYGAWRAGEIRSAGWRALRQPGDLLAELSTDCA